MVQPSLDGRQTPYEEVLPANGDGKRRPRIFVDAIERDGKHIDNQLFVQIR